MKLASTGKYFAIASFILLVLFLPLQSLGLSLPGIITPPITGSEKKAVPSLKGSSPRPSTQALSGQVLEAPVAGRSSYLGSGALALQQPVRLAEAAVAEAPVPTQAAAPTLQDTYSPEFQGFVEQVRDERPDIIRGVYVEGVLALPVMQQPEGDNAFVYSQSGMITQFMSASRRGVTGLLAHNYLDGLLFYEFEEGQEVRVVYGDGKVRRYLIEGVHQFQKLTPSSLHSDFIELATGERLTTSQVFNRFYSGEHRITFQTCLERDGLSNWGLTFTTAYPIE